MSYSTQTKTHFSFVPADMPHGYLKPLCKTPGPRSARSQPVSPGPAGPPPESEHFMAAPHSLFTMSFPIWGWPTPVWHVFILLCVYAQSGPTFCDPVNLSLPGSSFHGIFQTSILQWVVISYSSIYIYARHEFNDLDYKNKTYIYGNLKSTFIYIFSLGTVHSGLEVRWLEKWNWGSINESAAGGMPYTLTAGRNDS